jgi:hypothetical protein
LIEIAPPAPPVAAPEDIETEPDVPAAVVPVEKAIEPLTPEALPEFEVFTITLPLSDAVVSPFLPD